MDVQSGGGGIQERQPFKRWRFLQSPGLLVLYVVVSTPVAILVGLFGGQFLLPLVQAAVIFPVFVVLITREQWTRAVITMVFWAAWSGVIVVILTMWLEPTMEPRIILSESYREEMFAWISTGVGPEGDVRQFLPQHLFHSILFSGLTVVTGGFLGLAMGAVLMNYMSFYVGSLLSHSLDLAGVVYLAWPVWAALRVIAFIIVATALSALFWDRLGMTTAEPRRVMRFLLAGAVLLLLDVLLKWQFAPFWQQWLKALTNLG